MISPPSIIPLFPLPNLVLFPGVVVPLHIFEHRYRAMVSEVSRTHNIIGMVLLKGNWQAEYYAYSQIYSIGCAGRIVKLDELPDGRFNLLLQGIAEFRIEQEIRERTYRQARVEWCALARQSTGLGEFESAEIRRMLAELMGSEGEQTFDRVLELKLPDWQVVNFLCFHLDFDPLEKQALLEALDHRAPYLQDLLAFKLQERRGGGGGQDGGSIPAQ
jgi:Lon protease-like protein